MSFSFLSVLLRLTRREAGKRQGVPSKNRVPWGGGDQVKTDTQGQYVEKRQHDDAERPKPDL